MSRECSACSETKPSSQFYFDKTKGKVMSKCKVCWRDYMRPRCRAHYLKNKTVYQARNARVRRETNAFVKAYKTTHPTCADCKLDHPHYRLDFDHLPGYRKKVDISNAGSRGMSKEKVLEEIAKCEIVCANCHRDRTYKRIRNGSNVRP